MPKLKFAHYEDVRLRKIANLCKPGATLDLGFAESPNPYLNLNRTTGLDLQKNTSSTKYSRELIGNVENIGDIFIENTFENIIAGELLEHVENPYRFLRDIKPLLASEGRLILSTPNPIGWPVVLFEYAMSRRFFYTDEHTFYFSPRWVLRMLAKCGYGTDKVTSVGLWSPLITLPCPSVLSYQVIYSAHVKVRSNEQ